VDLRKLHDSVGFDIIGRYRQMHGQYEAAGFTDEAAWLAQRLAFLNQSSWLST
jgi:hypothetical protein